MKLAPTGRVEGGPENSYIFKKKNEGKMHTASEFGYI